MMKCTNMLRRMMAIVLASVTLASGASAPTTVMAATSVQASTESAAKQLTLNNSVKNTIYKEQYQSYYFIIPDNGFYYVDIDDTDLGNDSLNHIEMSISVGGNTYITKTTTYDFIFYDHAFNFSPGTKVTVTVNASDRCVSKNGFKYYITIKKCTSVPACKGYTWKIKIPTTHTEKENNNRMSTAQQIYRKTSTGKDIWYMGMALNADSGSKKTYEYSNPDFYKYEVTSSGKYRVIIEYPDIHYYGSREVTARLYKNSLSSVIGEGLTYGKSTDEGGLRSFVKSKTNSSDQTVTLKKGDTLYVRIGSAFAGQHSFYRFRIEKV